jgi:hypothetical protein
LQAQLLPSNKTLLSLGICDKKRHLLSTTPKHKKKSRTTWKLRNTFNDGLKEKSKPYLIEKL